MGILEQIENSDNTYQPLTLERLKEVFAELEKHRPVEPMHELPIYFALSLPDKEFIAFMKSDANVRLIGGLDAYTKLQERMKLHGLSVIKDKVQSLIDTILPKTANERIVVIGEGSHFDYFINLLYKRTGIDFKKNYVHCWYPNKLRGANWSKIIILNHYSEVSKFYREFEYFEQVKKTSIIDVEDRDL